MGMRICRPKGVRIRAELYTRARLRGSKKLSCDVYFSGFRLLGVKPGLRLPISFWFLYHLGKRYRGLPDLAPAISLSLLFAAGAASLS